MDVYATDVDVVKRLGRALTADELANILPGLLEEATILVRGHIGFDPRDLTDPLSPVVPDAVVIVTSRAVARVLGQGQTAGTEEFGADSLGRQVGPFGKQITYTRGTRDGGPWLTKADKVALDVVKESDKAFSVDTVSTDSIHATTCALLLGALYCSCGADIAGYPLYGV